MKWVNLARRSVENPLYSLHKRSHDVNTECQKLLHMETSWYEFGGGSTTILCISSVWKLQIPSHIQQAHLSQKY